MTLHVGVTATRRRLTAEQHLWLLQEMRSINQEAEAGNRGKAIVLHHGDCTGGDAAAHDLAVSMGWAVVIHPPIESRHRAFKQVPEDGVSKILTAKKYHARNRSLVRACSIILGVPGIPLWATQQGARRKEAPAHVVTGTELHGPKDGYYLTGRAGGKTSGGVDSGTWHTLLMALEARDGLGEQGQEAGGQGKEVRICSIVQ